MRSSPAARPVALVTGASSGIGAASATALAAQGFNVAIAYASNKDGAETVRQACIGKGGEAIALRCDLADADAGATLVDQTIEEWGRLDVLVSNAGITKFVDARDLDGLTAEDFAQIFAVNVTAAYGLAQAATPHLKVSPIASIVAISSHSGVSGIGSSHAYSASKGALNTLTLGLARALAPDIRVNAVCPGYVNTPWHAGKTSSDAELEDYMQKFTDIAPLKRLTQAGDVAEAVVFFATGAKAITGQLLVIDGGTHLTTATPQTI